MVQNWGYIIHNYQYIMKEEYKKTGIKIPVY